MKILLVAVNAKFIHTNLAVRYLQNALAKQKIDSEILEFNINGSPAEVLARIAEKKADAVCFSVYIWNADFIDRVISDLKKLPNAPAVVLGGPEASFDAPEILAAHPEIAAVVCGEGETALPLLLSALARKETPTGIPGVCARDIAGRIVRAAPSPDFDLARTNLPYGPNDIELLRNRIAYYEASRGCPYRCAYCLSAGEKVRLRPLELVKKDLDFFLESGVRQVKFVDRSFNADADFAQEIWRYLILNDNGLTNFHFEIAAETLCEASLEILESARPALFQLEIGVQSTNPATLRAVRRSPNTSEILSKAARLRRKGNINIHLDLIAGLPHEGYESFKQSFNRVFSARPHQLQIGFLKLLKGSHLREHAPDYGIVSSDFAPYRVLYTDNLDFFELVKLEKIEETVELYFNSGRYIRTVEKLLGYFDSPFGLFEELAEFIAERYSSFSLMGRMQSYDLLAEFARRKSFTSDLVYEIRADIMSNERPRRFPERAVLPYPERFKKIAAGLSANEEFLNLYGLTRQKLKHDCFAEIFPAGSLFSPDRDTFVVFDYSDRDLTGNARCTVIPLSEDVLRANP